MVLKEENVREKAQQCFQKFPTIILGSGASADYGLPITGDLKEHITTKVEKMITVQKEKKENRDWRTVLEVLKSETYLENALDAMPIMKLDYISEIVQWTWDCINSKDIKVMRRMISKGTNFYIGDLLSGMFESSWQQAHVITTNYDRVVEYACSSKGIPVRTGFPQGYPQKWEIFRHLKENDEARTSKVVSVHKVHGSLDWFMTSDNSMISLPVANDPSRRHTPLILTPGVTKYQRAYEDPFRTMIQNADNAIDSSNAILCIGFGFGDSHIQPRIRTACSYRHIPIIILARDLTDGIEKFLRECNEDDNCLVITKRKDGEGSTVYTPQPEQSCQKNIHEYGNDISATRLWSGTGFCKMVL